MDCIIVDPSAKSRDALKEILYQSSIINNTKLFSKADEAINYAKCIQKGHDKISLAFLETKIGKFSGIDLAVELRKIFPRIFIIFTSLDTSYAMAAFEINALGYIIKPVTTEKVQKELDYITTVIPAIARKRVFAHTFGNFDLFVNDYPVTFSSAKAKELLAYLIDRKGASVTCEQAIAVLWEDRPYDDKTRSLCRMVMSSLRQTLKEVGIYDIIEEKRNAKCIKPERILCDYYAFLNGNKFFVHQYMGEYMQQYSWASEAAATLDMGKDIYLK